LFLFVATADSPGEYKIFKRKVKVPILVIERKGLEVIPDSRQSSLQVTACIV